MANDPDASALVTDEKKKVFEGPVVAFLYGADGERGETDTPDTPGGT